MFDKGEEVRFLSHLDVTRQLVRGVRRSRIPVAYSRGFTPRPRVQFGPPLPVGAASETEFADLFFERAVFPGELLDSLGPQMPPGLRLRAVWPVPQRSPSLSVILVGASYRVSCPHGSWSPGEQVEELMSREEVEFRDGRAGVRGKTPGSVKVRDKIAQIGLLEGQEQVVEMKLLGGMNPFAVAGWLVDRGGAGSGVMDRLKVVRLEQYISEAGKLVALGSAHQHDLLKDS